MGTKHRVWIRHALGTALLSICIASAHAASSPEKTLLATPARALSDFELTSHENKPVRLSQLRGSPVLLFFGFAHCPDICPAALQKLRQLEREHRSALGPTRIVIVSVDGERDSPQAMKQWLQPISKNFLGLTGPPAKVREIAREFSAAFFKAAGKTPSEYLVEHNSQIFLIDANGNLHATFFDAPAATMAGVVRDVRTAK